MSKGTLQQVILRINGSKSNSQIAVFRCNQHERLDAVFASTVKTQQMIKQKHQGLIGVYDGTMNLDQIVQELKEHIICAT